MRTREELLEIIKNKDLILESNFTEDELDKISGDDFDSALDFLKFTQKNREYYLKMADYCEKNMKKDLDL